MRTRVINDITIDQNEMKFKKNHICVGKIVNQKRWRLCVSHMNEWKLWMKFKYFFATFYLFLLHDQSTSWNNQIVEVLSKLGKFFLVSLQNLHTYVWYNYCCLCGKVHLLQLMSDDAKFRTVLLQCIMFFYT